MVRVDRDKGEEEKRNEKGEMLQKGTWKEQRVTMYQAVAPPACPAMVDRRFELDRGRSGSASCLYTLPMPKRGTIMPSLSSCSRA